MSFISIIIFIAIASGNNSLIIFVAMTDICRSLLLAIILDGREFLDSAEGMRRVVLMHFWLMMSQASENW